MSHKSWNLTRAENVLLALATAVAVALSGSGAAAQGKSARKDKKSLPLAVSNAIQENRPGAEIDKLDIEKENGMVV